MKKKIGVYNMYFTAMRCLGYPNRSCRIKSIIIITIVFLLIIVLCFNYFTPLLDKSLQISPTSTLLSHFHHHNTNMIFPKLVHQMWKDEFSSIPNDLKRWRNGCIQLNQDFNFKLYYDDDLKKFIESEYPIYLPLFNSLNGVYMADMARVLLTYHYGGH